jgi:hypothetical protein
MHLPCKEVLSNTKEKKNLGVCMTLQQWSKVVYAEGNPCLKAPKRLDHIHKSHPRGWTTFTNLIQEVGPHSQLSSKRLDHIHKSHPRGWTTFTTLIQEVGPH